VDERDEKKNEALIAVVEPSVDQKISNTGYKFYRIFSIDSLLNIQKERKKEVLFERNYEFII
jgi:hypothetical protein